MLGLQEIPNSNEIFHKPAAGWQNKLWEFRGARDVKGHVEKVEAEANGE